MRMLEKDKREFYLAKKNGNIYNEPILCNASITTLTNKYILASIGALTNNVIQIVVDNEYEVEFKDGDKLYVYVAPTDTYDKLADKADFIVSSVVPSRTSITITAKGVQ